MEKIIRLFAPLLYFLSYIFTIKFKSRLFHFHQVVYFFWIKRYFKSLGKAKFMLPLYLEKPEYITIGNHTTIGRRTLLCVHRTSEDSKAEIVIGDNCSIGDDCNIQCCNHIYIENGVLLGRKVMINDTSHGTFDKEQLLIPPVKRPIVSKGPIVIEENVWIGEMVCILGNVHIGKGSIIGAGSVVTKDIPNYSLAVGNPAHVVKSISVI